MRTVDRIDGTPRWTRGFPGPGLLSRDISVTKQGESAVLGSIVAPVSLDGVTLVPEGAEDTFLLKLSP